MKLQFMTYIILVNWKQTFNFLISREVQLIYIFLPVSAINFNIRVITFLISYVIFLTSYVFFQCSYELDWNF